MEVTTVLFDCDGVLYPSLQLSMKEMIDCAMEEIYALVSKQEAKEISEQCFAKGHLGLFNYLLAVNGYNLKKFEQSSKRIVNNIDYSKIMPNHELLDMINKMKEQVDVCIFTNNVEAHVQKVFERLFDKSIEQTQIKCFDIVSTFDSGSFNPKQGRGLELIWKKLNLNSPFECLLIDDTQKNINAAQRIGMRGLHFKQDYCIVKTIKALL